MSTLILATEIFCIAAAALQFLSIGLVIVRVRRPAACALGPNEGISIIRPLCGLETFSEGTLRATFRLDHSRYEILFCVADATDAIVPLVSRLIAAHPEIPARLLIGNDCISSNPKLNNVAKGWTAATHSWVVMADSNVLMPPDYLQRLFSTWRADTGLVSSPALGCSPNGFWAELECAFLNTYQARWQCFADGIGLGFAQGKTLMFRRELLEAAGGIRALSCELAEDAASTKIMRRQGLRVRVVDKPFMQPLGPRLRRDTFLVYFIPELFGGGLWPLVGIALIAIWSDWPPMLALLTLSLFAAAWYGAEAVLTIAAGWHVSLQSPAAWLVRDLLLPVLWFASWAGQNFEWRGNPMTIANEDRWDARHGKEEAPTARA